MTFDYHEHFQQKIDELLISQRTIQEDEALCQHLETCLLCRDYLSLNTRVIASFAELSFDIDPTTPARIGASLRIRAQQMDSLPLVRRRPLWIFAIAVALTITGSWIDLQISDFMSLLFDFQKTQARDEVVRFWIIPAFLFLSLFPMLTQLSKHKQQTERSFK